MKNKLYDISQTLRFGIPVWPGDSAFRVEWMRRIAKGGSVNVSTIHLSTHTGTHTDAPYHFSEGGAGIDEVPLGRYLGPAEVVDIAGAPRVEERHLRGLDLTSLERVLFHTLTGDPGDVFPG
ncbi:MAG: cyclase family protein, partial [Acidobacteriota bacterium]